MGVIACAACGAKVNKEAAYCPACGSDPRSGAPGPLTDAAIANDLNRRARLAIGEAELSPYTLPAPDRKRVRHLRLAILATTIAALVGAGAFVLLWWPSFLGSRVSWDESLTSPDGRWQERDVGFYSAGVLTDVPGRMWVEVRASGSHAWRSAYLGDYGDVAWKGDNLVFTWSDPLADQPSSSSASIDPRHRVRLVLVNPGETVFVLLVIVALGALLFAVVPWLLTRRRVRRLVRESLAHLARSDWLGLADLCLLSDQRPEARRELAERLARSHGARLASQPPRLLGMEHRGFVSPSVRCVHLRFGGRGEVRTFAPLLVAATADAWHLVPAFGLLSTEPEDLKTLARSWRPNATTIAALVCAIIACPASFLPFVGVLAAIPGLFALASGLMGYGNLRRRRGPAMIAGLAVVLGGIAIVVAVAQALFLWALYVLPPTASLN